MHMATLGTIISIVDFDQAHILRVNLQYDILVQMATSGLLGNAHKLMWLFEAWWWCYVMMRPCD